MNTGSNSHASSSHASSSHAARSQAPKPEIMGAEIGAQAGRSVSALARTVISAAPHAAGVLGAQLGKNAAASTVR